MPYRTISFTFGAGLREGQDSKVQEPGTPRSLRNLRKLKTGRLGVRPDFVAASMGTTGGQTFYAQDVVSLRRRLLGIGNDSAASDPPEDIFEYLDEDIAAWRPTDAGRERRINPCTNVRNVGRIPAQDASVTVLDVAASGGLVCLVCEAGFDGDDEGTSTVHVFRAEDDATLLIERIDVTRPRVCAVDGVFFITGVDEGVLKLWRFDPASDTALTALTDAFATGDEITAYDLAAEEDDGGFVIALARDTPTITVVRFTAAGASTQTITGAAEAAIAIAVMSDGASRVHVAAVESDNDVQLYTYAIGDGSLESGPTEAASSSGLQPGLTRTGASQIALVYGVLGSSHGIKAELYAESDHTLASTLEWKAVQLTGKPLGNIAGGVLAVPARTLNNALSQATNLLLDLASGQPLCALDRLVSVSLTTSHQPQLARDASTGRVYWARSAVASSGMTAGAPVLAELELGSTARRQTATLGNGLYLAGGTVDRYDGRQLVESGFLGEPIIVTVDGSAGSGSVSDGEETAATVTGFVGVDPPIVVPQLGDPDPGTLNGLTILISVDSGSYQSVTFDGNDDDPATIAATINAATTGLTVTTSGDRLVFTSDTTGASSRLLFAGHQTALLALGVSFGLDVAGTSTPAVYQLAAIWEWVDAAGKLHRSRPSRVREVEMASGDNQVDVTVTLPPTKRRNDTNDEYGSACNVVVYMTSDTEANGGDFTLFRAASAFADRGMDAGPTVSISVTTSNETLEEQEVLYTQASRGALSGPLPFDAPDAAVYLWPSSDRILSGGLPQRESIQESRPMFPGEPVNWSDSIGFRRDLTGDIVGVVRLDERRIVFTEREIYELDGPGVDDTGAGDIGAPRRLLSDVGLHDWRSLVAYRGGVMFQGQPDKVYRLPRGSVVPEWVGEPVEDTLAAYPVISAAVYVPQDHTVCFACNNSAGTDAVVLVFDVTVDQWYVYGPFGDPIASMTEHDGELVLVIDGVVYLQSSATPSTFIEREWRGGTIHPFELHQQGRLDSIHFRGTYRGDCTLTCRVSFDDGAAFEEFETEIDGATLGLSAGDTFLHSWHPEQQSCDRFRVDFVETALDDQATNGLEWHDWAVTLSSEGKPSLRDPTEQS